jgi:hypothetical protein
MVKRLKTSRMARPTSSWAMRKITACRTETAPLGIGRSAVRATRASKSRSTMSL